MSTEDIIRKGMLHDKKQNFLKAVIDGKSALQALLNEAMHAKGRPFEATNVEALNSHLERVKAKKAECVKLMTEIMELE